MDMKGVLSSSGNEMSIIISIDPFTVINSWTLLYDLGYNKHNKRIWKVRCQCGSEKIRQLASILKGESTSCGCQWMVHSGRKVVPDGQSAFTNLWHTYKRRALSDGLVFELSRSQAVELFRSDCFYCGDPPQRQWKVGKYKRSVANYNGIDRVDNAVGYTPDNCVTCCTTCNTAKSNLTVSEFSRKVALWHAKLVSEGWIQ